MRYNQFCNKCAIQSQISFLVNDKHAITNGTTFQNHAGRQQQEDGDHPRQHRPPEAPGAQLRGQEQRGAVHKLRPGLLRHGPHRGGVGVQRRAGEGEVGGGAERGRGR